MNKYAIFDLDGTLFDSMDYWDGVGREFLKRYGIKEFPEEFNTKVKAMSIAQSSEYFRETFGVDETVEYIAESMRELVADKYRYEAEFKPNVRETLEILAGRNVKMCIATATYRELINEALDRLKARHYFEFILSCNDIGKGKDDPLIYNTALKRLGGTKDDTVIIEDALHAITTAKNNGFKVVAMSEKHQLCNKDEIMRLADRYLDVMDADTILEV